MFTGQRGERCAGLSGSSLGTETASLWVGKLRFGHICGGGQGLLRCEEREVVRHEQLLKVWIAEVLEKGCGQDSTSSVLVGCVLFTRPGLLWVGLHGATLGRPERKDQL